jgi:hypothetical protein
MILTEVANAEPDSERAYSLWLDAVIASRTAGCATLYEVFVHGLDIPARAESGKSQASLSQLQRLGAIILSPAPLSYDWMRIHVGLT